MTNQQVLLRRRPTGMPTTDDFELVDRPVAEPAEGEVVRRTIYLSLDPYMRGRMSDRRSYAASVALGDVMVGATVSEIVASRHPDFDEGDVVVGYDGWQLYAVGPPLGLRRLDPASAPLSTAIGVLGMPGFTAWYGLTEIGRARAGETVVVSAASGAVGSVVGQLARLRGCRSVGVAGGAAKCAWVTGTLRFDACVDHKSETMAADLAAACPVGHRRLLRQRRRRGARRCAGAGQRARADPALRIDQPVQRRRDRGRPGLGTAARQARARAGLHHHATTGPRTSRRSCASAHRSCRAARSSIARTSSKASTLRLPPSSASSRAATSAS